MALPFSDGLLVTTEEGGVAALDAAGRQLWEALQLGCTVEELVNAGVEHGGVSVEVAQANISRTLESWRALGLIEALAPLGRPAPPATPVVGRSLGPMPALDAIYLVGDRPVRVRCEDIVLGRVIDAACGSYRVDGERTALACIDVIEQGDGFAVKADDAVLAKSGAATRNPALARHRCLTALLEMARPSRQWLGILHASGVSVDGRCLLFPGAKGSGKSTLAAALVAGGAGFVTDDYAPLERGSWHVWPVPYAPGIKRGAWQALRRHYPDLDGRPVHELAQMRIRYLDLAVSRVAPLSPGLPVAALIFPSFDAGAALEQRRITAAEAFAELCHASSMLDRRPEILAETLLWIESIPAYQLVYGELERAVDRIPSLLRLG